MRMFIEKREDGLWIVCEGEMIGPYRDTAEGLGEAREDLKGLKKFWAVWGRLKDFVKISTEDVNRVLEESEGVPFRES